jgi:uncharacterized protein (TIGR03000 family)
MVFTKESVMNVRKCLLASLVATLAWAETAQVSEAQIYIGGGRGYGRGYGWSNGYGYGGYNRNWGYGSGSGYGQGYYGRGVSVGIGNGYYNNGYYSPGSNYGNTYVGGSTPTLMTNSSGNTSSYQSFYPSNGSMSSGDCCCAATGPAVSANGSSTSSSDYANLNYSDGRGVVVVNVPDNAEVFWNGNRSTMFGASRRFSTPPLNNDGTVQKFEARWRGPDGQVVTQSREIRAMPNQTVVLDFNRARQDGSEESSVNDTNRVNTNGTTIPNTNNNNRPNTALPNNPTPLTNPVPPNTPDRRND